jgi:hypothetical protein
MDLQVTYLKQLDSTVRFDHEALANLSTIVRYFAFYGREMCLPTSDIIRAKLTPEVEGTDQASNNERYEHYCFEIVFQPCAHSRRVDYFLHTIV